MDERRIEVGQLSENGALTLRHPDALDLHAMWSALRGDRPAPFRAELDATKIGAKAPFLSIFEHAGPSNFRVRIAGDRLNRWFGVELRGMSALSMIAAAGRNHAQAALNRVVAEPAVAALHGAARAADGGHSLFEMVLLPMRSDFGRVDRVLAGVWLLDAPAPVAHPFLLEPHRVVVAPVAADAAGEGPRRNEAPHPTPAAPALQTIEGAGEGAEPEPGQRRRDRSHLRLVKNG